MRWLDSLARRLRAPAADQVAETMAAAYDAAQRDDYPKALALWTPLAHAGVARAQNNIGACFSEGLGVERDPRLAERWLTLSAEAGDPVGLRNLAALYFNGAERVEQDHARASQLYRKAAEAGDAVSQDMLSWILLEEDSAGDPAEARRWAEAAAAQGIASSMTRLGMIFHNAIGVERDAAAACTWWRRGAEAGDADGQAMLGAAYHLGAGLPRDGVAAYAWLLRGHRGGSALAIPFLDPVQRSLTQDEIAAAETQANQPIRSTAS